MSCLIDGSKLGLQVMIRESIKFWDLHDTPCDLEVPPGGRGGSRDWSAAIAAATTAATAAAMQPPMATASLVESPPAPAPVEDLIGDPDEEDNSSSDIVEARRIDLGNVASDSDANSDGSSLASPGESPVGMRLPSHTRF